MSAHIPLYTLLAIVKDHYHASWFDDEDFYSEYLAEKDLALITHFVQLLWDKLRNHLPEEVMKVVWTYTRTYNHIEYYFFYPDLYMESLCTYWINGVKTRSERQELLSLLCLELSSLLDEVNGTTHVLAKNKLPDLISGSLVYCFRIPVGRSSDHGSSFSK